MGGAGGALTKWGWRGRGPICHDIFWRFSSCPLPKEASTLIFKIQSCIVRTDLKNKAFFLLISCLFLTSDLTVQDRILKIRVLASLGFWRPFLTFTDERSSYLRGGQRNFWGTFGFPFQSTQRSSGFVAPYLAMLRYYCCDTPPREASTLIFKIRSCSVRSDL